MPDRDAIVDSEPSRTKVNLTLAVLGAREDGYHDLDSVFLRLAFGDVVGARHRGGDLDRLASLTGSALTPDVAAADIAALRSDNLVLRAAALVRSETAGDLPAIEFTLEKEAWIGAGLGGGSGDAAAALRLVCRVWGLGLSERQLLDLGARAGSDVAFFIADAMAARVGGRGEIVDAFPPLASSPQVALFIGPEQLSTRDVFARHGPAVSSTASRVTQELAALLRPGAAGEVLVDRAAELRDANDLWASASALLPELVERRATLESRLRRPVMLSGSGPTLFALFRRDEDADEIVAAGAADAGGLRFTVTNAA